MSSATDLTVLVSSSLTACWLHSSSKYATCLCIAWYKMYWQCHSGVSSSPYAILLITNSFREITANMAHFTDFRWLFIFYRKSSFLSFHLLGISTNFSCAVEACAKFYRNSCKAICMQPCDCKLHFTNILFPSLFCAWGMIGGMGLVANLLSFYPPQAVLEPINVRPSNNGSKPQTWCGGY